MTKRVQYTEEVCSISHCLQIRAFSQECLTGVCVCVHAFKTAVIGWDVEELVRNMLQYKNISHAPKTQLL